MVHISFVLFRSAVLFHTKKFRLCVHDIDDSLKQGYPDHLKYKIYERKAKCLQELGEKDGVVKLYERTLEKLEVSNLDEKDKMKFRKSVNERLKDLQNGRLPSGKKLVDKRDSNLEHVCMVQMWIRCAFHSLFQKMGETFLICMLSRCSEQYSIKFYYFTSLIQFLALFYSTFQNYIIALLLIIAVKPNMQNELFMF